MIVPQFWAEARIQDRLDGRQVTVRRFGWSDSSQQDAQANADQRAREALARFAAGEKLAKREPKVPYNGAVGVPIREEIVERPDDAIVTRNAYGARCLNTPDVLFADIDFQTEPSFRWYFTIIVTLLVWAISTKWLLHFRAPWVALCVAAVLFGAIAAGPLFKLRQLLVGGEEKQARARINAFIARKPQWHLRLYRTPAGFRLLAMHRTFDPTEAAVAECFESLGVDRLYARMCLNQRCFRARVSPKPWRIGIAAHIRPRPGVWPVNPQRLPERVRWIEGYEEAARGYASCRFVEALGNRQVDPRALAIQTLHDEWCRSNSGLPIA